MCTYNNKTKHPYNQKIKNKKPRLVMQRAHISVLVKLGNNHPHNTLTKNRVGKLSILFFLGIFNFKSYKITYHQSNPFAKIHLLKFTLVLVLCLELIFLVILLISTSSRSSKK